MQANSKKIDAEELAASIKLSLQEWESEKWQDVIKLANEKGEELLNKVKQDSPINTGKYKRGFKKKTIQENGRICVKVVNNSNRKSIMHLLEDGHAINGGTGRAKAYPHLRKNEKEVNEEFFKGAKQTYEQ